MHSHPSSPANVPASRAAGVALSAAARRLLDGLLEPEAYAVASEFGEELVLVGRRGTVSMRLGAYRPDVADALVAASLAAWEGGGRSGKRRLVATAAGLANHARRAAPAGVDPFRAQHGAIEAPTPGRPGPAIERAESPLAWLATRRGKAGVPLVSALGLEAGERLRRDLTIAQVLPSMTASWSPMPRGDRNPDAMSVTEAAVAARQRVHRALDAAGPDFAGLLVDVCGFLKGLEAVEQERGWPARSAKVVLRLALAALARHYGLSEEARGPARGTPRGWGADDYRPTIS